MATSTNSGSLPDTATTNNSTPADAAPTSNTTKRYIPAPSAYDPPLVSLPAEMRPYAASLERLNTGTRRMGEEQRYTVSQEKLDKMQMIALEARLQRGLSRRLTGQDASSKNRVGPGGDSEKVAMREQAS